MGSKELEQSILARYDAMARRYAQAHGHVGSAGCAGDASGLGCARLADLIELFPGETVLDVGSGPGLETIALARRVAPAPAFGLDVLPSMVEVARENARRAGTTNLRFLEGPMEAIPLEDSSIDVVVSNCVINLSQDKERVMREICRVLRPGGRLVIADLVWLSRPPSWVRSAPEAWACCIGGALEATEYLGLLERAGFGSIKLRTSDCAAGLASTLVTARKPGAPGLGFQVREAQPEDIDLVLRILDAARLPTAGVAEHLPSFLLACTPDGNVVGVVGLERYHSSALLRSLVVLPSWRNQGLGRRLVASQLARLTPETPVYLLTAGAEAYFRSLGFEVIPRDQVCPEVKASAEFQGACPASAVAMRSIAHRNPGK